MGQESNARSASGLSLPVKPVFASYSSTLASFIRELHQSGDEKDWWPTTPAMIIHFSRAPYSW